MTGGNLIDAGTENGRSTPNLPAAGVKPLKSWYWSRRRPEARPPPRSGGCCEREFPHRGEAYPAAMQYPGLPGVDSRGLAEPG